MQVGEDYFFLEMNTRVQVEHCVTEMVTGIDIVREQLHIAAGEPLSIAQDDVELRGHAIECRINAEAAHKNFAPAPGPIASYIEPAGPGVRVDSGLEAGGEVTPLYDPMVAKLIVWDVDRAAATKRMLRALGEYRIEPLTTLIPFHQAVMASDDWANASTFRDKIEDKKWLKALTPETAPVPKASEEEEPETERTYQVEVNGRLHSVRVIGAAAPAVNPGATAAKRPPKRERSGGGGAAASGPDLPSPLQGTIFRVAVEQGQEVAEGDLVCVIEAMKMENEITAHRAGKIAEIRVTEGASVNSGDVLAVIE
jgi:acetyl-CoA/propionyl-CoA carboxylase biotin carboxyl carrier protein